MSASAFLYERFVRIVPMYWMASIPFLWIGEQSIGSIGNTFGFLPLFSAGNKFEYPIHPMGWSICFEMWFYLLFATIMLLVPAPRRLTFFVAAVATLVAVGYGYGYGSLGTFFFNPIALEFAAGVILFKLVPANRSVGVVMLSVAVIALAWCAHTYQDLGDRAAIAWNWRSALQRLIHWGIPCIAVLAGIVMIERGGSMPWPRWLVALGDASFSIYLVQGLTIEAARNLYWPDWRIGACAYVISTIVTGLIAHRVLEKPLMRFLKPRAVDTSSQPAEALN
jgi:exopolysaccharide production protein ExoZ